MAKLYYFFGAMGSCKSAHLLTTAFNYREKGMKPLLLTSAIDTRNNGQIQSRLGICQKAIPINKDQNIHELFMHYPKADVVLVDEVNFFTSDQIDQLSEICDIHNVDVLCYGIRTDFQTHLFEGSKRLMEIADNIEELKTMCHCGKKATINARTSDGKIIKNGDQILIGGNESYTALCRHCWKMDKLS